MLQLLRVIAVGVLVFAGLVLASIRWPIPHLRLGVWKDHRAEILLQAPSAVERFNERKAGEAPETQDKDTPLVRQAKALAEILNPAVQTPTAPTTNTVKPAGSGRVTPPQTSAKFKVVGISYSPSDPQNSFAYIQILPGDTFQWVQPGSTIGHQVVKEIKSGSIVCSDGPRTSEMPVELPLDTASVLESGAASSAVATPAAPGPVPASGSNLRSELANRAIAAVNSRALSRLNPREEESVEELARRIKELHNKGARAGGDDSNTVVADANVISQMISEFKSSRVSPEEANKLDDLGKQLNGTKEDSATTKRREPMKRLNLPRSSKQ